LGKETDGKIFLASGEKKKLGQGKNENRLSPLSI
jgi:hypothetical protein